MNPSECLCVALCVYQGGSEAQTRPVSGHTEERDAIAGRPDEWAARRALTKTNVTAPVPPQREAALNSLRGDHVTLTASPLSYSRPLLAEPEVVE